ncbi:MAG: hypothetical protein ABI625_07015 [bacterium]
MTAGNLWLWLPQLRASVETGGPLSFGLQAAVLASTTGDAAGLFDTDADAAERSGRPASEARVSVKWGEDDHPSEFGCGGHIAWVAVPSALARTDALACDARVALGPVEFRGEAYTGHGLRGLGGGGVSQNLSRTGNPLEDSGGWGQLNVDATLNGAPRGGMWRRRAGGERGERGWPPAQSIMCGLHDHSPGWAAVSGR